MRTIKVISVILEAVSSKLHTKFLSDSEINSQNRSLNHKQRQIFDFIHNSVNLHAKNKSGTISKQSTPFYLFLSTSGICGKSQMTKIFFVLLVRYF